jgi:hypothetical protein
MPKKWQQQTYKLPKGHGWRAKPGYNVFVADRGALRFDYPKDWVVQPSDDAYIEFHDKPPPDDDCLLKVTLMRLHPGVDWTGLPVADLLRDLRKTDSRPLHSRGQVVHVQREDLELAWVEDRFVDPTALREACSRVCLARRGTILPFITMDFWLDDLERFSPVWDELLRSLQLGVYISDPLKHFQH